MKTLREIITLDDLDLLGEITAEFGARAKEIEAKGGVAGWTRWGIDEKGRQYELKDSPRYQLCGNGEARAWGEWIATRLVKIVNGESV